MSRVLYVILILLLSTPAWGASTETCPAVENGVWEAGNVVLLSNNALFDYKSTTWTCATYWHDNYWYLWRKVPYKIDWECIRWEEVFVSTRCKKQWEGYGRYLPKPKGYSHICDPKKKCVRWRGFREDGIVVWRKEDD